MYDSRFETMKHIDTVRLFINMVIKELLNRQFQHDKTKLKSPEVEIFNEYTPKLADVTYGSEEYKQFMKEMRVAIKHHNQHNRHHPEFHKDGIKGMTLIDLIEMICDWKAASMRHNDGNVFKSIEINQERFGYSDELKQIFLNTLWYLGAFEVFYEENNLNLVENKNE